MLSTHLLTLEWLKVHNNFKYMLCTVQLNSKFTLECVSLASTRKVSNIRYSSIQS